MYEKVRNLILTDSEGNCVTLTAVNFEVSQGPELAVLPLRSDMVGIESAIPRRLVMPFYCQRCGAGLPPSARFCSNCGNVVTAAPPSPGRPLVRPIAGRQIAGVCIGVAQANGWDVTLVRVLTVVGCVFTSGLVGVAYLAGWIGIPEEPIAFPGNYPSAAPGTYPPGSYPPGTPGGYPPSV